MSLTHTPSVPGDALDWHLRRCNVAGKHRSCHKNGLELRQQRVRVGRQHLGLLQECTCQCCQLLLAGGQRRASLTHLHLQPLHSVTCLWPLPCKLQGSRLHRTRHRGLVDWYNHASHHSEGSGTENRHNCLLVFVNSAGLNTNAVEPRPMLDLGQQHGQSAEAG